MKAADLAAAARVADERAGNVAMRRRLTGLEPLKLSIGGDGKAAEIVMSAAWIDTVRHDLIAAFNARIDDNDAALAALGVEP